jgi:hypothetical protein
MEDLELVVDHEVFRVHERRRGRGAPTYDFEWLNGPGDGGYGFSARLAGIDTAFPGPQLQVEARRFVEAFYGPGGIGATDFPEHVRARERAHGG